MSWYRRRAKVSAIAVCGFALLHADGVRAVDHDRGVELRGIVRAINYAAVSTDLQARVRRIGFREGEVFKVGDILIEFDCARQWQELAALDAVEREMRVAVETSEVLMRRGAGNRNDNDISSARHDRARAEAGAMRTRLGQCTIAAPFDGSVVELLINAHEYAPSARPFLVIAGVTPLEIEIIAPSKMTEAMRPGAEFEFRVDEIARSLPVRVARTGGAVDPVSQTLKIYAAFSIPHPGVLPGMSGTLRFEPRGGQHGSEAKGR